jgi:hypothetical protein
VIPTYDGSGQATHPDVLRDPNAADPRLLMAMTPYPYSDGQIENPSLLASRNGMVFREIAGVVNPLVPPPPVVHGDDPDHNDDPDLRWDAGAGEYELIYLESEPPVKQTVVSLRSTDLITWTRRDAIVFDLGRGDPFIVSPAVVQDGKTTHMFYVSLLSTGFEIETLTSPDGRTWDATTATPIAIDLGNVSPWHIDVVTGPAGYALLISGFTGERYKPQSLYIATSKDLETWTLDPEPLLSHADPALGVTTLYRSTGLVAGTSLVVWYSMQYRQ